MYYEFTILLQGCKQYQFTPHDRACEGPFQWRYWAAGRDAKRVTGDAFDTEPGHRDHLVRPPTGRLRFWHSHGVTRAVLQIGDWIERDDGRRAFSAELVEEGPVFDAWVGELGRRVEFVTAARNPIMYWPRTTS